MKNGLKHRVVSTVCALLVYAACLSVVAETEAFVDGTSRSPNVLIILADDLGYGDVGCYGATKVRTPNIDALAEQGVRFTDAHSPAAVCQPSRYGVMTGRYNWRRGKPWDGTYMFSDKHPTLQQVLGRAGYATAAFGKWHNGWGLGPVDFNKALSPGPLESGFDSYFGTPRTHNEPPQVFVENRNVYRLDPKDPIRIIEHDEVVTRGLKDWGWGLSEGAAAAHAARPQDQVDLIVADRAADYLRERPKDEPFFLYVAFVAPHVPISPSARFQGTSDAGQYGDFLQQLDTSVGTVLDALKEQGFDENTLVIFSSDNGAVYMHSAIEAGHHSNGNLLGQKTDAWCGGNQVPFIVRWPGKVPEGKTSDAFVSLTDIMATVTAATGVETPDTAIDSINQLPVILNPAEKSIRTEMIYTGIFGQGIYSDGWVYYPFQGSGGMTAHPTQRWGQPYQNTGMVNSDHAADGTLKADAPSGQLYNVKDDPGQTTNVYEKYPERVATLKKRLAELIAPPAAPSGNGSTLSTGSAAPRKAPVSWNAEVWGEPANGPAVGNHYIHDRSDVWLLALGQNGPFPGRTLTLKNNASIWLTGGGPLGKGLLVLDGGQIQNRCSGRTAVVLGRIRVDSASTILNIEGDLELKSGLSGSGNLSIAAFQRAGTSVVISGPDQGYAGSFVLADSAEDGVRLNVEFATAFASAGLSFQNGRSGRFPKLLLKNDLVFRSVQLPSAKDPGALISLKAGCYDAAALQKAGVDPSAVEDRGGTLTVGSRSAAGIPGGAPNILFLIVDDLATRLGCYGDEAAITPNLDRLASGGVLFERAYACGTVCTPSRKSFMTGLDVRKIGWGNNNFLKDNPDAMTLPRWFREHGYQTAKVGKVQHKDEFEGPFDWDFNLNKTEHFPAGNAGKVVNTIESLDGKILAKVHIRRDDQPSIDEGRTEAFERFVEKQWDRSMPFFFALGYHSAHQPSDPNRCYLDMHALDTMPLTVPPAGATPMSKPFPSGWKGWSNQFPEDRQRQAVQGYYAAVTMLDDLIGRALLFLEEQGLADNTIIVFTADQGYCLGYRTVWAKHIQYPPVLRVPLIVRYPGMPNRGVRAEGLVELLDIFPTLAELSGLPNPKGIDGVSFVPLLEDPTLDGKQAVYAQEILHQGRGVSVTTKNGTYLEWDNGACREFYDLGKDPDAWVNQAENPEYAADVKVHQKLLRDFYVGGVYTMSTN